MELRSTTMTVLAHSGNGGNENARELFFDDKNIIKIVTGVFHKYVSLQTLVLSKNKISELPTNIFDSLKELKILDLSQNKITTLDSKLFKNNKRLKMLSVSLNEITELSRELFENLSELLILNINGNKINAFDFTCLKYCNKLKVIHFSDNFLRKINVLSNWKNVFPKLELCSLHNNNFSCTYLRFIVQSLENQGVQIFELDKSKTIKTDSVYGLKCLADNMYLKSGKVEIKKNGESTISNEGSNIINDLQVNLEDKEERIQKLTQEGTELREQLAINKLHMKELSDEIVKLRSDTNDNNHSMLKIIDEMQQKQLRADEELNLLRQDNQGKMDELRNVWTTVNLMNSKLENQEISIQRFSAEFSKLLVHFSTLSEAFAVSEAQRIELIAGIEKLSKNFENKIKWLMVVAAIVTASNDHAESDVDEDDESE